MESTIRELLADVPGATIEGNPETRIRSIAFDSRQVKLGGLFVALRGGYADGHDYLDNARAAGACAAMVEPETPESVVAGFDAIVRVRNTRGALSPVAAAFYRHPSQDLTVIGVTGTDGKTTTSFYISQLLELLGSSSGLISTVAVRVPGRPDSSSARQTTPESLDVQRILAEILAAGGQIAVLETTSHALETHRVDSCKFDIGVVTNVTHEHLDFHGSVENYRKAKAGLLRKVNASRAAGGTGIVVMNADDPGARSIASDAGDSTVLWYTRGGDASATISASNIETSAIGSRFDLRIGSFQAPVDFPLPGSWNISNLLAATGALHALGYGAERIAAAIPQLSPVPGRLASVDVGQPFTVVVDYAHTPESIKSVLTELRSLTTSRLLIAFGSAGERDIEKRSAQGRIAAELADYAVFTSEDPRFEDPDSIIAEIARGASEHGWKQGVDFECIEDRRAAIAHLFAQAGPGDVVILAGKGHETSMIYGSEQRPWNEARVAREVLIESGFGQQEVKGT